MLRSEIVYEKLISVMIILVSLLIMGGIGYYTVFRTDSGGIEKKDEMILMPDLVGYSYEEAADYYKDLIVIKESGREYSEEYSEGAVISQSIEAGEECARGSEVEVVVSSGAETSETAVTVAETADTPVTEETVSETAAAAVGNAAAEFEKYIPDEEVELSSPGFDINDPMFEDIYNELYDILRPFGVDVSYLYYDTSTGCSMEYNADERFSAGSIIKAIYARSILDGSVDLDAEYEMTEEMLNSPSELIGGKPVGTKFTVRELIEAALVKSDNTAYKMLYNYIGYEKFNSYAASLGLPQRMTKDNYWFRLTARESAVYFKEICNFIHQNENGGFMHDCMTNTDYDMFSSALPDKEIAEKYGFLPQEDYYTLGECAIVSGGEGNEYILVMYSRGTGETADTEPFINAAAATDMFHEIFRNIYAENGGIPSENENSGSIPSDEIPGIDEEDIAD